MKRIIDGAWVVPMGFANATLLQAADGELVLVDAGFPGHQQDVFDALAALGRAPDELEHIVFTHAHPDHIGSAAAVVARTGARTWMHTVDAPISESGGPFRPMTPSPRLVQRVGFRVFWRPDEPITAVGIDERIEDGQTLPLAGGLEVVHTPGHSAGHVSLLWAPGDLMIVGDVGSNVLGVSDPLGFEDRAAGRASQRRLAERDFSAAAFGHGRAIPADAARRMRKRWGA
jgi:glyoxylase-like metal-dependent hydrolase (beta-lactamase superfamily II)